MSLNLSEVITVSKEVLRGNIWILFQNDSNCYLHFGYDFYMYLGLPGLSYEEINKIGIEGLFIEEMVSPYLK